MRCSLVIVFFIYCHGLSIERSRVARDREVAQESQNSFYPSFPEYNFQPLGHSRPFFFNSQQEGAYSQRSEPFQQIFDSPPEKLGGYKDDSRPASQPPPPESLGLLGSGNFGVIPGGTFYTDNDKSASSSSSSSSSSYGDVGFDPYDLRNGHGRPSYRFGASSRKPHEQFADFRDFADINTPSERQYSEYVVVYVNRNGTAPPATSVGRGFAPKNIIERLAMLDLEEEEEAPPKKLSKSKRKLAKALPEKKHLVKNKQKSKASKDFNEPLLALS